MNKLLALVVVIIALFATVNAMSLSDSQYEFLFTRFIDQYEKTYLTSDVLTRYNIFKSNLDYILYTNSQNLEFQLGINQFSDLNSEEFAQVFLTGLSQEQDQLHGDNYAGVFEGIDIPDGLLGNVDWRSSGKVAPIRNQGSCGSCYSFAAISALESANARKTGKMTLLSDQQAVDCSTANNGCNGGLPSSVYQYAKSGICTQGSYPYTGKKGACKKCSPAVKVSSYQSIATNDNAHRTALSSRGPLAIAVDASSTNFQHYKSGILGSCPLKQYNHAVNLVGYKSTDYYILRNSWGTSWGERGYMRVKPGACGTARSNLDVVPIV